MVAGFCALLMRPRRLVRSAIVLKSSTLLNLHRALTKRKYRLLFSTKAPTKQGPKGPSEEVVAAVVDMKRRNPTWGCPRIPQQIALAFDIAINKDVVRRILAVQCQPGPESAGPSWLTVLGHAKDSLWSLDLFRCESAVLRTLGARRDGPMHASHRRLWRPSRRRGWRGAVPDVQSSDAMPNPPKYLSSDHDQRSLDLRGGLKPLGRIVRQARANDRVQPRLGERRPFPISGSAGQHLVQDDAERKRSERASAARPSHCSGDI